MGAMLESYRGHHPRVHSSAFVHASAIVIGQVAVGEQSTVWPAVTMRGDDGTITIGNRTSIQDGTVVHTTEGLSTVTVGNQVTVGHNVILHGCAVEDDCIIGMGSIIMDNAVIERGAIIGAGTLVPMGKRVAAGTVVVGNPMRVLRTCTLKDSDWIVHSWKEYVERGIEYLAARPTP